MKELKITKGVWTVRKTTKGHSYISGEGWVDFCKVYNQTDFIDVETLQESNANAKLIADAGTTANKCGLLPSELLEQRNELLQAIKLIANLSIDHAVIRFAIKKYKKFENENPIQTYK